jgi:hypothetical protein
MNYVAECDRLIESLVGKDLIGRWWASPNKAFENRTPAVVFEEDPRAVYEYLMWHAYGAGG